MSTSTAVLICQATLVIFTSFGGGVFITWNRTPSYWRWLQEISVFTQASRAIISNINNIMVYRCPILLPFPLNVCAPVGFVVDCDIAAQKPNEPFCLVSGRGMLHGIQGTSETDSPWVSFGYLFLIFVVARLGVLLLMYYPSDRISAAVRAFFSTGVQDQIIQVQQRNRCIEGTGQYSRHVYIVTSIYSVSLHSKSHPTPPHYSLLFVYALEHLISSTLLNSPESCFNSPSLAPFVHLQSNWHR